jgi:PAS domain-containing protein
MRVICSYCRAELAPKEPLEDDAITHTMCPDCLDHFGRQAEGWSLGELLDQFDVPVLAVDCDGRAIAANQATAEMVGKSRRELFGMLGGDLMECAYARLPGGCGKTIHCKACAIRNTVQKTIETGSPQLRVQAYLNHYDHLDEPDSHRCRPDHRRADEDRLRGRRSIAPCGSERVVGSCADTHTEPSPHRILAMIDPQP